MKQGERRERGGGAVEREKSGGSWQDEKSQETINKARTDKPNQKPTGGILEENFAHKTSAFAFSNQKKKIFLRRYF